MDIPLNNRDYQVKTRRGQFQHCFFAAIGAIHILEISVEQWLIELDPGLAVYAEHLKELG